MAQTHTPGPWDVHSGARGLEIHPLSDAEGESPIADVLTGPGDAALMAAAPAMLAALREILAAYDGPHRGDYGAQSDAVFDAIEATGARDLIAAATGAPTDETGAAAPTDEPAREFMAFCQQADGRGTIWIDKVRGDTIEAATAAAREACAADWGCQADKVHCLGLIEGAATVAHWQDVCEGGL